MAVSIASTACPGQRSYVPLCLMARMTSKPYETCSDKMILSPLSDKSDMWPKLDKHENVSTISSSFLNNLWGGKNTPNIEWLDALCGVNVYSSVYLFYLC